MRAERGPGEERQDEEHQPSAHERRQRAPGRAHRRAAEVTVNEDPIQPRIREIRGDNRPHDRRDAVQRLQRLTEHDENEEGQHARNRDAHIGGRVGNNLRLLAGEHEHAMHRHEHERGVRSQHERQRQATLHRA